MYNYWQLAEAAGRGFFSKKSTQKKTEASH